MQNISENIELKLCPFCGSEAYIEKMKDDSLWWCACSECEALQTSTKGKLDAIAKWNTRSESEACVLSLVELREVGLNETAVWVKTQLWAGWAVLRGTKMADCFYVMTSAYECAPWELRLYSRNYSLLELERNGWVAYNRKPSGGGHIGGSVLRGEQT